MEGGWIDRGGPGWKVDGSTGGNPGWKVDGVTMGGALLAAAAFAAACVGVWLVRRGLCGSDVGAG